MAEARTIGSTGDLYRVLLDSNLYARVEQVSSNVNCYDAAGHLVLKTTGYTDIAAYIDASHSFPATSLGTINQAFLCERGVLLTKYYSGTLRHVYVLSRTNTGEPAFVDLDVTGDDWTALTWGDITPITEKDMPPQTANQYALLPFVTNAAVGVDSYMPDAFYAAVSPGNQLPRGFLMHGTRWFAVGNAVLRDGTA